MPVVKQRNGTKVPFAAPAPGSSLKHLSPGERGGGAVWPRVGVGWEGLPVLPHRSPPPHPKREGAVLGAAPVLDERGCFRPKGRDELSGERRLAQHLLITAFPAYIIFVSLFREESMTKS